MLGMVNATMQTGQHTGMSVVNPPNLLEPIAMLFVPGFAPIAPSMGMKRTPINCSGLNLAIKMRGLLILFAIDRHTNQELN